MITRKVLLGSSLVATFVLAACQDEPTSLPVAPPAPRANAELAGQAPSAGSANDFSLVRGETRFPSLGLLADMTIGTGADAIDPADYVCSRASGVNTFIKRAISGSIAAERTRFFQAYNLLADLLPAYEALYFQSSATPQYFGYDGEHTKAITKAQRERDGFWDLESSGIQVLAMHGDVLLDTIRTARVYRLFGFSPATSARFARTMRGAIDGSTTMTNGRHPLFTFNAFAFTTFGGSIPDKIVMGDGIMAAYDALGFGDVAPQAILAHEFAHHVQFDNGYGIAGDAAERTRFIELSADAMAAYYLTHARGGTMNKHRVAEFLQVFFQIGDCGFTSRGHHGTPNQRLKAAQLGFAIADEARKQGHILGADAFHARFVAAYPGLVAPDAR